MVHFVGFDVSVKQTSVCIVDEAGSATRHSRAKIELIGSRGRIRRLGELRINGAAIDVPKSQ